MPVLLECMACLVHRQLASLAQPLRAKGQIHTHLGQAVTSLQIAPIQFERVAAVPFDEPVIFQREVARSTVCVSHLSKAVSIPALHECSSKARTDRSRRIRLPLASSAP